MVIVAVFAGIVVLLLLILAIPLDLAWHLEVYGRPRLNLRLAWLFGLLGREIKTQRRVSEKKERKKKASKRKYSLYRTARGIQAGLEYFNIPELVPRIIRFLKQIMRSVQFSRVEAEFLFGTGDPEESFYLYALLEPVNRWLNSTRLPSIQVRVSFRETVLEGYARGNLRLYPLQLVPPVLQMIFSRPFWRVIRKVIADRWRKNKSESKNR